MVWCGVVWCGVVWCGVVWCGVVWCGVVWCGVVWCGVVWYGMVWYATALKWTVCSYRCPDIDVNLSFLHIMFSSVFDSFSLATTCSHTMC